MSYTGLEMFMENLKEVIYSHGNPRINNRPEIVSERPQVQMLYEELAFVRQMLFDENRHELDEVSNLKTRFNDVVEEAHNIMGLFLFSINVRVENPPSRRNFIKSFLKFKGVRRPRNSKYLNLDGVMSSIKYIKEEYTKMDLDPSIGHQKTQSVVVSAGTSSTRNLMGTKKVMEETVVGLQHHVELIRDQLVQDHKQLDVVSIVGMGGLGKTTLATKVFNDPFVVYHFHVRAWVTVSQTYEKQDLLIQILISIGVKVDFGGRRYKYSQLRKMLHKILMGQRYLVVIDDIWSTKAWDDLNIFFPNDNTASRIILTSRLKKVALHAKQHGFIHHLSNLTDEESWELLRKKVFHSNDCPDWLIKPGMQIAKNCHGLPLAVVVIAGVLAKEAISKKSWEKIGHSVSSYIISDGNEYADMVALSYDHLPLHLKDCFLYLGGFPEDYKFKIQRLIWLWMAEGFIQEDGKRSLEEIGEDYLMELVDRNLVLVASRKFDGGIKTCSVHDLLRELCLKKASKEHFCLKINTPLRKFSSISRCKLRRIFTNIDLFHNYAFNQPTPRLQSLLCFRGSLPLINICNGYFHLYPFLMVLDLQKCLLHTFPESIELLVFLRYLAIWYNGRFPSGVCKIWSLQTLIFRSVLPISLPKSISNLVNLRHLSSDKLIYFETSETPMNLRTISKVTLADGARGWAKYFPDIKKLASSTHADDDHDFESLISLETLMWITTGLHRRIMGGLEYPKINLRFPASLKKLSLVGCYLPWSDISIIKSLPNLEVLKLLKNSFLGPIWETGEEEFQQLKFLKLQELNIQQWEASSINFPCLKRLVVDRCNDLEEIPLELGNIPTLEFIEVDDSNISVVESLNRVQEEQQDVGNYDLTISVGEASDRSLSDLKSQELDFWETCFSPITYKAPSVL